MLQLNRSQLNRTLVLLGGPREAQVTPRFARPKRLASLGHSASLRSGGLSSASGWTPQALTPCGIQGICGKAKLEIHLWYCKQAGQRPPGRVRRARQAAQAGGHGKQGKHGRQGRQGKQQARQARQARQAMEAKQARQARQENTHLAQFAMCQMCQKGLVERRPPAAGRSPVAVRRALPSLGLPPLFSYNNFREAWPQGH